MKRILHLIESLGKGGAEHLLMNTVNGLPECIHYVVFLKAPTELTNQIRAEMVYCLNQHSKWDVLSSIMQLKKLIAIWKIDIVHSHSYWTHLISRLSVSRSVSLFNSYHFADYETNPNMIARLRMIVLDRLTYRKHIHIIAVSDYVKSILEATCRYKNIIVLKNFVGGIFEVEPQYRYTPLKEGQLNLIAFGNLKKEKNYELLIEAFKSLRNLPLTLDVYGQGPSLEKFRQILERDNIRNLRFKGPAPIGPDLIWQYDAYVMTSYSEACPLSPIEAMHCGLPLILSDIPSLKEVASEQALFFRNRSIQCFISLIEDIIEGKQNLFYIRKYDKILYKYSKQYYFNKLKQIYTFIHVE